MDTRINTGSPRLHANFSDWLLPRTVSSSAFRSVDLKFTYDGQSALFQAFGALRKYRAGRVLVPALHCPTVVEPILRAGFDIDFYDVDYNLRQPAIPFNELLTDAHHILLVINYFGFPFDLSGVAALPIGKRPLIVEDCCHSFLDASGESLTGDRGDLAIYSFKKLVPCYTGGAIRYNRADIPRPPPATRLGWLPQVSHARQVLGDSARFSSCGAVQRINPLPPPPPPLSSSPALPPLEDAYPFSEELARAEMPALARRILEHSDLIACARQRRINYAVIAKCLRASSHIEQPIPELDARTCPWGYPILLNRREDFDYKMRNRGVPFFSFAEQLHPALHNNSRDFPIAADISDRLLFLSAHQQLNEAQVERYCADIVNLFSEAT